MHITYVLSSLSVANYTDKLTIEEGLQKIRDDGLGVELLDLWGTYSGLYERIHWNRWKNALKDMPRTVHAQFTIYPPYPDDFDMVKSMQNQIDFAKYVGAIIFVAHDFHLSPSTERNTIADHGMAGEIIAYAEEQGVQLALENGNYEMLEEALEKHPTVKVCFDTGHAAFPVQYPHRDIDLPYHGFEQMIDLVKSRLVHVHLQDCRGFADDHQPLGVRHGIGEERWQYLLAAMKEYDFDGVANLEIGSGTAETQLERSLDFLMEECKFNEPKGHTLPYHQSVLDPEWKRPCIPKKPKVEVEYVASWRGFNKRLLRAEIEPTMRQLKGMGLGYEISDTWMNAPGHMEKSYWDRWAAVCKDMPVTVCGTPAPQPKFGGNSDWSGWFKDQLDFCKHVDSKIYVMPVEVLKALPENILGNDDHTLATALDYAGERGIQIAIENGSLQTISQLIATHPSLRVCLNIGHAILDNNNSFRELIDTLIGHTVYIHMSNNRGAQMEYLPLDIRNGLPVDDWRYLTDALAKVAYKGTVCLEMVPYDHKYVCEASFDFLCNECGWPSP